MILALVIVLAANCIFCLAILRRQQQRNPLAERLKKHVEAESAASVPGVALGLGQTNLPGWLIRLAGWGELLAGKGKGREKLEILLIQASWRQKEALGLFMLVKTVLGVVLVMAVLLSGEQKGAGLSTMALVLGAYFMGGFLPELVLKAQVARRFNAIMRSMPDALDLMVICAEAGLPFPRILKVVARDLELSAPELADELAFTSAELQLLPDRSNALRHLAERTRVPTVESMVSTLIQAERYGTPLAQALRNIAEESRNTLILSLEEKAGKLPARLSIPLMTLILPPVVALVATPPLMRVIRSLM